MEYWKILLINYRFRSYDFVLNSLMNLFVMILFVRNYGTEAIIMTNNKSLCLNLIESFITHLILQGDRSLNVSDH